MEIKVTQSSKKTTLDLAMTDSQEKAIQNGIIRIMFNERRYLRPGYKKVLRDLHITQLDHGSISVWMKIDNDKPGTFGHTYPTIRHFFVGKRGGYTCFSNDKKRKNNKTGRVTGWKALIYC